MTDKPTSASDPRSGSRPYYINEECPACGTPLVLYDAISDEAMRESDELADPDLVDRDGSIWHDEFVCPSCLDGVHMDWPQDTCCECGDEHAIQMIDEKGRCASCIPEDEWVELEFASKEDIEDAFEG